MSNSKYNKSLDAHQEVNKTPEITTKMFQFDKANGHFVGDGMNLFLLPTERFAFFMMRGTSKNITFAYAESRVIDNETWDFYTATTAPFYTCQIKRVA